MSKNSLVGGSILNSDSDMDSILFWNATQSRPLRAIYWLFLRFRCLIWIRYWSKWLKQYPPRLSLSQLSLWHFVVFLSDSDCFFFFSFFFKTWKESLVMEWVSTFPLFSHYIFYLYLRCTLLEFGCFIYAPFVDFLFCWCDGKEDGGGS